MGPGTKRCPVPLRVHEVTDRVQKQERENPMELFEASPKSAQNDAHYLSMLHSLGKVQDNGSSIQALTRRNLQNYLQNLQPPSLSHGVHICLALLWNTRSCSQLVLVFAVLGVSQLLELMGLWVKWQIMVPKWRERLSVDKREVCTHTHPHKITLLYHMTVNCPVLKCSRFYILTVNKSSVLKQLL